MAHRLRRQARCRSRCQNLKQHVLQSWAAPCHLLWALQKSQLLAPTMLLLPRGAWMRSSARYSMRVISPALIARIACRRKGRAHVRHGRDDLSSDTKLLQWSENSGASSIEVATHGEHSSLGISLAAHDAATSGRKFPRKFPESYTDSGSQISSRISGNLDQGQPTMGMALGLRLQCSACF